MNQPPPIPKRKRRVSPSLLVVFLVGLMGVTAVLLRGSNLLRPFKVPTGAMSPAIKPGDHVLMEGMSYLDGELERGDPMVFRTDKISHPGMSKTIFVMRAVGLPGERIQIKDGALFINDKPVTIKNKEGEIRYENMSSLANPENVITVPTNHYFVLGDASGNSFDSRYWGFVPADSVMGRVTFCYWPPSRVGGVK